MFSTKNLPETLSISNFHDFNGNLNDLKHIISVNKGIKVIEFNERWDPLCERFARRLKNVAAMNPDVTFLSINMEENYELISHYPISSVPHLKFIISDGENNFQEVDQAIGSNANNVQKKIENIRKNYSY